MTEFESPRRLSFPVSFPDIPPCLIIVRVPRASVAEHLGDPVLTDWVDGSGNTDFWAFEYPCGLQVVYQFMHDVEGGLVYSDSPEVNHVLRHSPFAERDCVRIDPVTLKSQLKLLLSRFPQRKDEIDSLHSFQVWRQGGDGNPFKVGDPTSKRDADCLVRHLDSLGHHQHYWTEKVVRQVPGSDMQQHG